MLHSQPTLGRSAECLRQSKRYFRRDAGLTLDETAKGLRGDIQEFSDLPMADSVRLEIYVVDELARMRRIVHAHQ